MKKHIILTGTILAAFALCWAICGGTATVGNVPAAAAESAVSAPCAPQTQPSEPSNNIVITQPETAPVAGSAASLESEYPQTTPTAVPVSTPAEKPATEQPAEESAQPQDGMVYVPGFGCLQSEGPGEWSVSEDMYENGNKVGIMG